MILDDALVAARDEDEMLDAGIPRLVDDMLNHRTVDDRQHLLGYRLGRGQEAGAKPCHGEHGLADASGHPVLVQSISPASGLAREVRTPSTAIRWQAANWW